jgi:glutathione peroxidase
MACGQCSCGGKHSHQPESRGSSRFNALIGVAAGVLVLGVVGLAVALEPPADKPGAPDKPRAAAPAGEPEAKPAPAPVESVSPQVLTHAVKRIDGSEENLSVYKGKVVMIVNTASKCGLTPQYEGLQKLYEQKKDAGLVILGFPANDFRRQEPGTNAEIAEFCSSKFNITFPMFEKIAVTGKDQHPLYKQLTAQPAPIGGEPKWNFTKFLVDRQGNVVARFEPRVKPDDPDLVKKIDELLAAK